MTTYEEVHAGAVILGYDGAPWGVEAIEHEPVLAVTLFRHGQRLTGYPPPGTEVTVIVPAEVTAEWIAAELLARAFGHVELISERWENQYHDGPDQRRP